jgi:hypothetical protein
MATLRFPFFGVDLLTANFRRFIRALAAPVATVVFAALALNACAGQQIAAPEPQTGSIAGTAMDAEQEVIPAARIALDGPHNLHSSAVADDNGAFTFDHVASGGPYHVTINATGFVSWTSQEVFVNPGQLVFLSGVKVPISGGESSITVSAVPAEIAVEQVKLEEQQRAFGFIPNFYVAYDHDPAPLTPRLKLSLALKAETDPVTFLGVAFIAAIDQAANHPDYVEGAKGYGQRIGANYATGSTDILFGGAILPILLHQDPRYFYQGTGTTRSRLLHALATPIICRGDSGRWEPNYSSIGGDLISGAFSETYYPKSNRGPGLVFNSALIAGAGRSANGLIQEFVLRRFTSNARAGTN